MKVNKNENVCDRKFPKFKILKPATKKWKYSITRVANGKILRLLHEYLVIRTWFSRTPHAIYTFGKVILICYDSSI